MREALGVPAGFRSCPFALPLPAPFYSRVFNDIEGVAARHPDKPAVRGVGRCWTYRNLMEVIQRIASVVPRDGTSVAIVGGKHFASLAALVGVMRAGAVAVPIDEELPPARQAELVTRAYAQLALLTGRSAQAPSDLPPLRMDPNTGQWLGSPPPTPSNPQAPMPNLTAAAYVYFTSGTTGEPKAVVGQHRSLDHFVAWERQAFGIGSMTRIAQLTTFSFDAILRDVLVAFASGGSVCLPDRMDDVLGILEWLEAERIEVVHTTPSFVGSWLTLSGQTHSVELRCLRLLCLAGEPLLASTVNNFRRVFPYCPARLVNFYGPTETTMIKSFLCVPEPPYPGVQPIGRPLPDTQILVLGSDDQVCSTGERGEIVIRTPFRAKGYLDLAPNSGFLPNPWRSDPDDLIYRTGDVGEVLPDGQILPLGRRDEIVKILGVRVHPAEIAALATAYPGVASCHIEQFTDREHATLVAFVVEDNLAAVSTKELREYLRARLPGPAVPSRFILLPELPLLPNGKTDRRALLDTYGTKEDRYVAPGTATEARLARLYADVLRTGPVSRTDDFFEIGGHSLLAAVLLTRIRIEFGVRLTLRSLLRSPTVVELAQVVDKPEDPGEVRKRSLLIELRPGDPCKPPLVPGPSDWR